MRKKYRFLGCMLLCMGLTLVNPGTVFATSETREVASDENTDGNEEELYEITDWVFDDYGILTDDEKETLNQELADIYEEYGYDAVLLITEDIEEDDYRKYAAEFMQDNDIGYGDTHEGMCIFSQPDRRNITIVFRGDTQDDFTESIQDDMLDRCKVKLKEGDMAGGYQSLIDDLIKGLNRICEGEKIRPMDMDGTPLTESILFYLILSFVVMAVPTLIMTIYQVRKMKTNVPQPNANAYEGEDGLILSEERDMFLYSTVSQTAKPKNDDNDSGSFSSGGESFSGSSSDY